MLLEKKKKKDWEEAYHRGKNERGAIGPHISAILLLVCEGIEYA